MLSSLVSMLPCSMVLSGEVGETAFIDQHAVAAGKKTMCKCAVCMKF